MKTKRSFLKRTIACVMVVIMTLTAVPLSGFVGMELPKQFETKASAATAGNLRYFVDNGEATITGYESSISGALVIPDTLGGYPVTSIRWKAFDNCRGLTSVTIPNSVTSIGTWAFQYCTGLTSVTIGDSVTSIGGSAFEKCTGLTSITIPDSVTSIGSNAFADTVWYNEQPDGDVYAGEVYYKYKGTMPENTSIVIKDGTKCIASQAFYNCTGLTSITIPDSVTSIGSSAFYNTAWYKAQPFGDVYAGKVYYKYKGTMLENTSIVIKDGTKGIADSAFKDCSGLTKITIPDSLTSIGGGAFDWCTNLTSVNISDLVSWCKIEFENLYSNPLYYAKKLYINGVLATNVTIPDSVTSIGTWAFCGHTGLTSITIPNSVTNIGYHAFSDCTGLTSITIPNSVTSIGDYAFSRCTGLTSVTIGNGVTSIGNSAFENCTGLTSVIIPDSVTSLGYDAFGYCYGLKSVTIGNGVETIKGYDNDYYNNDYDSIEYGAFYNCPLITIRIGKNVKTIEKNAFGGIKNIPEVYYAGSEEDWKNIAIDQSNDMILRATMYYNADISHTHSYTSKITKAATCTKNGTKTFTCDCGKTYTETIAATGHKSSSWITDKAATCTADGSKHKECTVCKTKLETATIPATGHSFKTTTVAATCTSVGYVTKTCSKCGECQFVKSIPAKGHSTKTAVVSPATESESGLSVTSCKTCGVITKATLIKRIASIKLSKTAYTYNGKAQTPSVVVKDTTGKTLKNGTDYTVKYSSGRKNPGKYTVTVTFKGNYSGKKNLTFTIAPKAPTLKVTAGSKKAALSWNKQTGASGYVVYMATSKSGNYSKIATVKGKVSYTKTGLTTGKTYYFKAAAYKTVDGKNICGSYSAVKSVKIK